MRPISEYFSFCHDMVYGKTPKEVIQKATPNFHTAPGCRKKEKYKIHVICGVDPIFQPWMMAGKLFGIIVISRHKDGFRGFLKTYKWIPPKGRTGLIPHDRGFGPGFHKERKRREK